MKVTLIHGRYNNSWEALGLGYIASYLHHHRPDLTITFHQGCFDSDDSIIADASDADIVAFSCTSPTVRHSVKLANAIKRENPRVHTVMGGYDPSARRLKTLEPGIDQAVVGEGEAAMLDIVNGKRDPLIFGRMMRFSELPHPDRALIRNERCVEAAAEITGTRITSVNSHRGCVFMCKFCGDGAVKQLYPNVSWKHKDLIRYRDIDDMLDEIEFITETYKLDLFKFAAPTWNLDLEWVKQYCRRKIARGIRVAYYPAMHVGLLDQEAAELMKESGCTQVAVGIESGSDTILKTIGKGTNTKSIRRCVTLLQNAGIGVRGYTILGMPLETWHTFYETLEFVKSLNLIEAGMTILANYPGTDGYDPERDKDIDWSDVDEYSNTMTSSLAMSNAELKEAQRIFADTFKEILPFHAKEVIEGTFDPGKNLGAVATATAA